MGWLILIGLMALSLGGLRLLRVRGAALTASAAALLLGGAGYALQGSPGLPGAPAEMTEAEGAPRVLWPVHAGGKLA